MKVDLTTYLVQPLHQKSAQTYAETAVKEFYLLRELCTANSEYDIARG